MTERCSAHEKLTENVSDVRGDVRELRVEFAHLAKSIADLAAAQNVFVGEFRATVQSLGQLVNAMNEQKTERWFSMGKALLVSMTAIATALITRGPDICRVIAGWIGLGQPGL